MERRAPRVAAAWQQALNDGDVERLVALSDPNVELAGPRGTARGAAALRTWVGRARLRLVPGRVFHRGSRVVVEAAAEWRGGERGGAASAATVATVFVVRAGRVVAVARHDDLTAALRAAGLDAADGTAAG